MGSASSVVGIDQMIGGTSADSGAAFADLVAQSKLARVLNPGKRRTWAIETFESVSEQWGPGGAAFEGEFVLHFELGAVEGLAAIAAMDPGALDRAKEQMPELVGGEVAKLGLGGAAVIQATFAKAADEIGRELVGLGAEIDPGGRAGLGEPRSRRRQGRAREAARPREPRARDVPRAERVR